MQEIGSSAAFLGQSEYTAHFGLKKEGIEILYSVRIKWLAESSTTKPYEEIYYNVPTRTTLNVHRRSLNKIVINDSGDELSECNAIRSDDIGILHNQISIDQEDDDDVKINNNNSDDAEDDLNTKLSPDRILYLKLMNRYRRAISFFQNKIDTVDSVLLKAKENSILDEQLLKMLERKYPFVASASVD